MYEKVKYISHDGDSGFCNMKDYVIQILCYGKFLTVKWMDKNGVTVCCTYDSIKSLLKDWEFTN